MYNYKFDCSNYYLILFSSHVCVSLKIMEKLLYELTSERRQLLAESFLDMIHELLHSNQLFYHNLAANSVSKHFPSHNIIQWETTVVDYRNDIVGLECLYQLCTQTHTHTYHHDTHIHYTCDIYTHIHIHIYILYTHARARTHTHTHFNVLVMVLCIYLVVCTYFPCSLLYFPSLKKTVLRTIGSMTSV